ncbi:unnamed protein product [Orchesella dallaii]|uniref:Uncharacterized protein n=1 Tax=Orchesella dallaii TaxID=48710 RepID=A0ABP1PV23_9HEXA
MAFKGVTVNAGTVSLFVFCTVMTVSMVQGLICNQCGTYIPTSVTPCLNLTKSSLQECPAETTHCAKYVSPAMVVYDCAKDCEEKAQWSFDIHCCSTDQCNGASSLTNSIPIYFMWTVSAAISLSFGGFLHNFRNAFYSITHNNVA